MPLSDDIYQRSPIWLQKVGVAAFGWWWFRRRFGPAFHQAVVDIGNRDRYSPEAFRAYQEQKLGELLEVARHSPHYRRVFEKAGVEPGEAPFDVLARLPILTKQQLRTEGRALLTRKPERGVHEFRSSGTTGTPTSVFFTPEFHQQVQAFFEARNRNWAGVRYDDKRVMFGVRKVCRPGQDQPPFWRVSPAERLAYCSIYHLSPRHLPAYVDFLNRYRPVVVMGYPSSLITVARFVLDRGLELWPAKAVITTSETLSPAVRTALEEAWRCQVYDQYCAVEACVLATNCEEGAYHLSPDFGVLEILDGAGNPCPPGQVGRAVCTGLHNTLQPLLRYEIGDALAWSEEECACGRSMPLLKSIEGRFEGLCFTRDGRAIRRFDTVFKDVDAIQEAQVVQEALDLFVVRVVPTPAFSDEDERRLVANMRLHVGDVECVVERTPSIERTSAGKLQAVISHVAPPEGHEL